MRQWQRLRVGEQVDEDLYIQHLPTDAQASDRHVLCGYFSIKIVHYRRRDIYPVGRQEVQHETRRGR